MKYNTFSSIYDTKKVYVKPETQTAYNTLCENVRSLTGEKHMDNVIKFLNSVLVDVFGAGITPNGNMIFKDDNDIKRVMDHTGHQESGYWFICNGEMTVKAIAEIYATMPNPITEDYVKNIGKIVGELLKKYSE